VLNYALYHMALLISTRCSYTTERRNVATHLHEPVVKSS
jgi:hypothetical protein